MAMDTGHFSPYRAQIQSPFGRLYFHEVLDRLAISLAVDKTADAANALRDIGHFIEIFGFRQPLQTAMDETY